MHLPSSRAVSVFISLVLGFAVSSRGQQDFSSVEIKTTKVSGNVHMLEGAGGNIAVLTGTDGVLIVDTQYAPLASKIETALKNLAPGKLHYIVNTHWHGDHTGGNEILGKGAAIVSHDNVRRRLAEKKEPAVAKSGLPQITHDHGVTLHFNDEVIRVRALSPGHTDGDSLVFFTRANVVHTGDQFINGKFPFVDLGSGGDLAGYIRNVEIALKEIPADAKIIPGHGPLATMADLKRFHEMLLETTAMIREAISEGRTLEQVKARGLPEKWSTWGTGFINSSRWLEITYNALKSSN